MDRRRKPIVAREGLPYLLAVLAATILAWRFGDAIHLAVALALLAWLWLIFRDPVRRVSAVPLGVLSPVDGRVVAVRSEHSPTLDRDVQTLVIRVNSLGTYTARCPVEGKIMEPGVMGQPNANGQRFNGLWVHTDESEDVILQFNGHRFGLAPKAFLGFGERVGQGQRCAYLRLTRFAEVQLPANSRILAEQGQKVVAGLDLLARLPHR